MLKTKPLTRVKEKNHYFLLLPYCFLVKGAKRGAIYNTKTGDVYSIDEIGTYFLDLLEKRNTISYAIKQTIKEKKTTGNKLVRFLLKLQNSELGYFSNNTTIQKIALNKMPDALNFLWVELTSKCNLRCIHCYANSDNTQNDILPINVIIKALKDARLLGCKKIQFTGGEIFTIGKSRIFAIIDAAKEIGFSSIELYTNCTIMDEEIITFLQKNKDRISIATSVYGPDSETHNTITQTANSFERTINNLRKLLVEGMRLRVGVIKMKQNEEKIGKTVKMLKDLGIRKSQIKIDTVRPSGRGLNRNLYASTDTHNHKFPLCKYPVFQKRHYFHNCFGDKLCITVSANVIPCIMARNIILGNLLEQSLNDIFYSPKAKEIRYLTKDKIEICKDCEYRYACFDCRIKTKSPLTWNSLYEKPVCSYNPYKGIWEK